MRLFPLVLAVSIAGPALAADLDCARIRTTDVPFGLSYKVTRTKDGRDLAPPTDETLQVYRRGREMVTYHFFAPGKFVRNRLADPLFPLESAASNGAVVRKWTYSIDTGGDRFGRREPLDFTSELREVNGSPFLQAASTIRFNGTTSVTVQGCKLEIAKVVRTNDGTMQGRQTRNQAELWISTELKTSLFSRITDGATLTTYTATGISTDVKPPE